MEEARKQLEFDWPRSRQLNALRDLRLPDVAAKDGSRVSAGVIKAVLACIDGFGRECFAAATTIAASVGFSLRHTKRALEVLEDPLGLITVETKKNPYGKVTNHYRIVWNDIEQLTRNAVPLRHSASPDQSAVVTDQSAVAAHKPPRSAKKNTPPPPSASKLQEWAEAERVFCEQGIGQPVLLVDRARARDLSPGECIQLAEYFAQHATTNGWGPGVLYSRIANARPGESIQARWIAPTKAARLREYEAQQQRERLQTSRHVAQARHTATELQTLEARYGPAVDALPKEVQRQLVGLAHHHAELALRSFGKSGLRSWVRTVCLEFIAAEPTWLDVLQSEAIT